MNTAGAEFTSEQRDIVCCAQDDRILVNAGAGTGKTHVLIGRLVHLVDECGLAAGSDILVLSFSRAAVYEVRRRTRNSGSSAAYSGVLTFDSFATQLLGVAADDDSWRAESYDGRIRKATAAIRENASAQEFVKDFKHVLIDEIQDLVGDRADFVMALLETCGCGFSLFGDPAQSIYDHQARDDTSTSSSDLYRFICDRFRESLQEHLLTRNFRALGEAPRHALQFGPLLQNENCYSPAVRHDLDTFLIGLPAMGDLGSVLPGWRRRPPISDAILCRTNGQVLLLLQLLSKAGIRCRLKAPATCRSAPQWIAEALVGLEGSHASRAGVLERLSASNDPAAAEQRWRLLKRLDGRRGDRLDLRSVASRIVGHALPEEMYEDDETGVLISTVHRAKGLEFDRVFVTKPRAADEVGDELEEARVIYVALTRARSWLGTLDDPGTRSMARHIGTARWVRYGYRGRHRLVEAMELLPGDVDQASPILSDSTAVLEESAARQDYLLRHVSVGDAVQLDLIEGRAADLEYRILHEGHTIGVMSETFTRHLMRLVRGEIPRSIAGGFVGAVETVAGNPDESRRAGLGSVGLWLGVRINGLIEVI